MPQFVAHHMFLFSPHDLPKYTGKKILFCYVLARFNFSNSFVMRFDHALEKRNINACYYDFIIAWQ